MTATISGDGTSTLINLTTSGNTVLGDASTDTLNVGNGGLVKDASGNVGIGTISPSIADFNASAAVLQGNKSDTNGFFFKATSSNTSAVFGAGNNTAFLYTLDSNVLRFGTNSTERMRLDTSGNLLVGQTSGSYVISAGASANNGAQIASLVMGRSGGEYGSVGYGVRYTGTSNSYTYDQSDTASMIRFNSGKVETFTAPIGSGGNAISFTTGPYVAQGGTSWTNSSDERLKDIIEPITGATNKVSQLRAVIGKFKTDPEDKRRSFLIAQDVQAVLPEAVDVSDPESLGVQYTDVIPLLVAAIKELKADLDATKAELAALKGQGINNV